MQTDEINRCYVVINESFFESPFAFVSKRVNVRDHSYEYEIRLRLIFMQIKLILIRTVLVEYSKMAYLPHPWFTFEYFQFSYLHCNRSCVQTHEISAEWAYQMNDLMHPHTPHNKNI